MQVNSNQRNITMAFDDNWTAERREAYDRKVAMNATYGRQADAELEDFQYRNEVGAVVLGRLLAAPFVWAWRKVRSIAKI